MCDQQADTFVPAGRRNYWLTPEQAKRITLYPWWYSRRLWLGFLAGFGAATLLWSL